jgi:hypothetical protein
LTHEQARALCERKNAEQGARRDELHAWQPPAPPGVPPTYGRSADAEERGGIRLALIVAGSMVLAGAALVAAILVTLVWDVSVATGHGSASAIRRIMLGTSALTLLAGVLILRSSGSLSREFLDHHRRGGSINPAGSDHQSSRNRRFLVGSGALVVGAGSLGIVLACTAWQ